MLAAGSSETACEPTGGVPIARPDRSGGGHGLAQHNRHLGGAAAGALKANFAACQPRSPGENDPGVPWLLKRVASLCPLAVEQRIRALPVGPQSARETMKLEASVFRMRCDAPHYAFRRFLSPL